MSHSEIIQPDGCEKENESQESNRIENNIKEEGKVSTPVPNSTKVKTNKSLLLDFTSYLSMNSGGENSSLRDRSRSYTPTKLFTRSSRAKCTPEELKTKLDEKQK